MQIACHLCSGWDRGAANTLRDRAILMRRVWKAGQGGQLGEGRLESVPQVTNLPHSA